MRWLGRVALLVVIVAGVVVAWRHGQQDAAADAAFLVRDRALHDSLEVITVQVGILDAAARAARDQLQAQAVAHQRAMVRTDTVRAGLEEGRRLAEDLAADMAASSDSLRAGLRILAAQALAFQVAASIERDSARGRISGLQAAVTADTVALDAMREQVRLAQEALAVKDARLALRSPRWPVRVSRGLVGFGAGALCTAGGWVAAGPAAGGVAGAACAGLVAGLALAGPAPITEQYERRCYFAATRAARPVSLMMCSPVPARSAL